MQLPQPLLDLWTSSLKSVLSPHIPQESLPDAIDLALFNITQNNITLAASDGDLSLKQLESHGLTKILEDLGTEYAVDQDEILDREFSLVKIESYTMLSATLIDQVLHPRPATPVTPAANRKRKGEAGSDCELCGRKMPVTIHHLVPRSTHVYFLRHPSLLSPPPYSSPSSSSSSHLKNQQASNQQGKEQGGRIRGEEEELTKEGLLKRQATLCRPCHSQIHKLIPDHRELGRDYNTIDRLREREDVRRWCGWVMGQRVSDAKMGQGVRYRR